MGKIFVSIIFLLLSTLLNAKEPFYHWIGKGGFEHKSTVPPRRYEFKAWIKAYPKPIFFDELPVVETKGFKQWKNYEKNRLQKWLYEDEKRQALKSMLEKFQEKEEKKRHEGAIILDVKVQREKAKKKEEEKKIQIEKDKKITQKPNWNGKFYWWLDKKGLQQVHGTAPKLIEFDRLMTAEEMSKELILDAKVIAYKNKMTEHFSKTVGNWQQDFIKKNLKKMENLSRKDTTKFMKDAGMPDLDKLVESSIIEKFKITPARMSAAILRESLDPAISKIVEGLFTMEPNWQGKYYWFVDNKKKKRFTSVSPKKVEFIRFLNEEEIKKELAQDMEIKKYRKVMVEFYNKEIAKWEKNFLKKNEDKFKTMSDDERNFFIERAKSNPESGRPDLNKSVKSAVINRFKISAIRYDALALRDSLKK
ncbi:hypothetical protein ACFL35_07980 [Candidatus Riflebacteria bacterium]